MGDFNIDLLNNSRYNNYSQMFLNGLFTHGFYPTILRPTRITDTSATLIDNIFVNVHDDRLGSGIWLADISDHLPVYVTLPYENKSFVAPINVIQKRIYSEENMDKFKNHIREIDWSPVYNAIGTDSKFDVFSQVISELHDMYFPLKTVRIMKPKNLIKPWITPSILNSIKKKNNLYKHYIRSRSPTLKQRYVQYKNKLVSLLRFAEKSYYAEKLTKVQDNMSKTWKLLNEITNRNKSPKIISQIKTNDELTDDPQQISEKFNNYFVNIGPDLASKIQVGNKKPLDYLVGEYNDSMYLAPTNEYEILDIIANLKNTPSKGHDDLPLKLIKNCSLALSPILAYLNNQSFSEGIFPDHLKIAKVIPIYKSDDPSLVSNYRPISVLTHFSKISEKLMYSRLNKYITDNAILHPSQFGFREKMSTALALLKLVEDISSSMDNGNITVGVFIDLAKAFDTVNHKILLDKLGHYGIRGIVNKWFESYLTNRMQYVDLNNCKSSRLYITCGVPQGSILGPLLFILYVNDLNSVSKILRSIMFADDTNLFLSGKSPAEVESKFNSELMDLSDWFQSNLLSLNVKKTSFIIFSNKRSINKNIIIKNHPIIQLEDTKFLGVIISSCLTWNQHISVVLNKISKTTGIIAKVRHLLPANLTRNLYLTLVQPYISYCNLVWSRAESSTQLDKILKIQKKYCRLLTFSDFRAHSKPLFVQLRLLNVYQIYQYQLGVFMYLQINNSPLNNISIMFTFHPNSSVHSHFTRQHNKIHIVRCRTKMRQLTLIYQGPKLWESFPASIRNSPSVTVFRRRLKLFLVSQ